MDAEQLKKITGYFILEAQEHLEAIAQALENFQATVDDPEQIQEIYRGAHSIKGGAAMLELESIRVTAHHLEDYFKFLKSSPLTVDDTLTSLISKVYKGLKTLVDKLDETLSLPEEFVKTVMGKVEPLFDRIGQHLETLSTTPPQSAGDNVDKISALPTTLQEEVLNALAEIGELHKQEDSPDRRAHIQTLCRHLAKLEQSAPRQEWTRFLEVAQIAIAYPKNDYQTTVQWIVRDLKEAVARLVAGDRAAIVPSPELLALAQNVVPLTPENAIAEASSSELNDLADLFEGDSLSFEGNWQEEAIDTEASDSNGFNGSDELSLTETDFGSLFDSQDSEESIGGTVEADPELKHELEDLFGGDAALEALEATEPIAPQLDLAADSGSDREFLTLGAQKEDESATADTDLDSLDNLFGEGFSFEEDENLTATPEFTGESPEFSAPNVSSRSPRTSMSPTLHDDLNKDLDAIFSDVTQNGETENLLAHSAFDWEVSDDSAPTPPEEGMPPVAMPETPEVAAELPDLEDMSDLLDITATSPVGETDFDFEDFDPFETFVQNDVPEIETIVPTARDRDRGSGVDDAFNALLNGNENELEDIDDLEAFLSGQPSAMDFDDRPHPQPRKNSKNNRQKNADEFAAEELAPRLGEISLTQASRGEENVEITVSSLESTPEAEGDDDFIAFLEGDNNMTNQESDVQDLDALLENIPDTAIAESVSPFSQEEFADLDGLELDEDEISKAVMEDWDIFSETPTISSSDSSTTPSDDFLDDNLFAPLAGEEREALLGEDLDNIENLLGDVSTGDGREIPGLAEALPESSPEEDDLAALLEMSEEITPEETPILEDLFESGEIPDLTAGLPESSPEEEDLAALLEIEESEAIATEETPILENLFEAREIPDLTAGLPESSPEEDLAALLEIEESGEESEIIATEETPILEDLFEAREIPDLAAGLPESSPEEEDLVALLEIEESETIATEETPILEDLFEAREIPDLTAGLLESSPEEEDLAALLEMSEEIAPEEPPALEETRSREDSGVTSERETEEMEGLEAFLEDAIADGLTPLTSEEFLMAAQATDEREAGAAISESELNYYDRIDELGALLDKPALSAKDLQVATTFAELEMLLESPAIGERETETREQETGNGEPESPATPPPMPEEDFGDVEEMLLRAQQQAGEIPLEATKRSQRPARPRTNKPKVEASLKVPVKQMDNLSNLVGELVVNRNSLEGDEERLRQFLDSLMHQVQNLSDVGGRMQDLYERSLLENALLRSRREYHAQQTQDFVPSTAATNANDSSFDELEMDSFSKFHELAQETIEMIVRVRESASDIQFLVDDIDQVARTLRQVTSQLQEGLTKSRMIPFGNTASRLPLAVRRIAPQLNKQAQLELEGQETLIDKMILEHLSDPLTHLVNNALTHGIEPPEVRLATGKSQMGHIKVSAMQQGNQTVISVTDDGGGIDSERVKQKALQKGLIDRDRAKHLSRLDVYDLLFHPGFSTKDQADNFAGRGVGLDVVRTSINEIRGAVSIDSKLGKGTTFTIRLPLTLSICKALCCISENAPISFPLDGVEDMIDLPQRKLQRNAQGQMCVPWRDTLLPYSHLSELLSYNRRIGRSNLYGGKREENILSVVILRGSGSHIAVGVDQVIGEQEIVIKQLYGPIPKPAGIAGATVQGDGKIMAIADVLELIEISEGRIRKDMGSSLWETTGGSEFETQERSLNESIVLIVDDSITVRELLSMSFSKAGYRVEQARDGQDAWDKLRSGMPCDIVFCDIEMPRVDGLEFLGRMQKDEELFDIPVAMLTSRGAERHRNVAAELGASGYFTKPYLEEVLLDAAERMIQGEVLLEGSTRKVREAKPKTKRVEPAPIEPPTLVQTSETMTIQPTVLIIDDSVTVRSLLSMTFENAGYHVEQARDGKEAWDKLKGGVSPDLALCDIEMPRLDGLELLGKIYEDEELQRIPVAMLTSRGAERHRKVAAERGASGYFTKPYVEQELLAAADRIRNGEVLLKNSVRQPGMTTSIGHSLFENGEQSVTRHPLPVTSDRGTGHREQGTGNGQRHHYQSSPSMMNEQPKVLIIDDSVTVRSLLSMTFEKAGYLVEQARDGKEALDKLQAGLNPDVVFCDIEMPKMDGLKLIATIQEDEELSQIPIAMLTSRGAKKHQIAAAERGAKGYFTKPYVEDVLLDAAQRLMNGEVLLRVEA